MVPNPLRCVNCLEPLDWPDSIEIAEAKKECPACGHTTELDDLPQMLWTLLGHLKDQVEGLRKDFREHVENEFDDGR